MITELDKLAFELYEKELIEMFGTSYSIGLFVTEHILVDELYKTYYDKAKQMLRKCKIQKINEKI